ncbi:MAG: leucyl/phenylalanyl-tRNA--protein transferase family protein [Treponema sp.]|nr:leucyl/phenylalanyl-tRNA--protein transferase family protein [Treponema sp.]
MYPLRYLPSGYIFIHPDDDCDGVVDAMLETGYSEEFCLARDFEEGFIGRLMEAGFLVMSAELKDDEESDDSGPDGEANSGGAEPAGTEPFFILLPKLHLIRSALFFPELHIKKSIRPFLGRYELRVNADFDYILDRCVQIHGADWLTPPLTDILKRLHRISSLHPGHLRARPVSFGVYRDGKLRAGEIGVVMGRVYTSYSGYYEEDNAGTVQIILMAQWLDQAGFDFLDLGMPLDYKTQLGARDITPHRFVKLFRQARF